MKTPDRRQAASRTLDCPSGALRGCVPTPLLNPTQIFLLSPASCAGRRAQLLLNERADFDIAGRLRSDAGATLNEIFSFLSALYFRGKVAYANAFALPPQDLPGSLVITPGRGLLPGDTIIRLSDLRAFADVRVAEDEPIYREPLARDAAHLARQLKGKCRVVLLGSIATNKYADVLTAALGKQLMFPQAFVGRGDMSRGGLMLRCVRDCRELEYVSVAGAVRRGSRPPKLPEL